MQVSEISANNYQPVVHQPLRSRKSPFAVSKCAKNSATTTTTSARNKSFDSSPFELHVQLRPFSDEKMLKKNLSQDNLLRADYMSRPNEKCEYLFILSRETFPTSTENSSLIGFKF